MGCTTIQIELHNKIVVNELQIADEAMTYRTQILQGIKKKGKIIYIIEVGYKRCTNEFIYL